MRTGLMETRPEALYYWYLYFPFTNATHAVPSGPWNFSISTSTNKLTYPLVDGINVTSQGPHLNAIILSAAVQLNNS